MLENLNTDLVTLEGGFVSDMLAPVALELSNVYLSLNRARWIAWVDETSGEYLDLAAEDIGIEPRKAGTKAQVTLQCSGTTGYTIPAGAAFLTEAGLYFYTFTDTTIPESGLVEIKAEAVGAVYNVEEETICHAVSNDIRLARGPGTVDVMIAGDDRQPVDIRVKVRATDPALKQSIAEAFRESLLEYLMTAAFGVPGGPDAGGVGDSARPSGDRSPGAGEHPGAAAYGWTDLLALPAADAAARNCGAGYAQSGVPVRVHASPIHTQTERSGGSWLNTGRS